MGGLTEWALEGEQKGFRNQVCETEEDAPLPSISICQYAQSGQSFCQTGWHRRSRYSCPCICLGIRVFFYAYIRQEMTSVSILVIASANPA